MEDPVWEVYQLRRSASFNVNYWARKLHPLERFDFLMERALLVAAFASMLTGLLCWQSATGGKVVWVILSAGTALLAIAKPLSRLAHKISTLREIIVEYRTTESLLGELSNHIKASGRYSTTMHDMFNALLDQYATAEVTEPCEAEDGKLCDECYEIVNRELPVDSLYLPPVDVFRRTAASRASGGIQ